MSKAYLLSTLRSIKNSFNRFISIIAVVMIGSGVFIGYWSTCPDMLRTSADYYKDNNLFDIRIRSHIGLYDGDLQRLQNVDGVKNITGQKFVDGFARVKDENGDYQGLIDLYGSEMTVRVYGLDTSLAMAFTQSGKNDGKYINRLTLVEGAYPAKVGECIVACNDIATPGEFKIGETIKIEGEDESILYSLKVDELTIVGVAMTPYYLSFERGETMIGSGKLGDYIYVSNETFADNINYYSEAYITLNDSHLFLPYDDEYNEYVDTVARKISGISSSIIAERAFILKSDIEPQIDAGEAELAAKQQQIDTELSEARKKLEEARFFVENGDALLDQAKKELETKYSEAIGQINSGSAEYTAAVTKYNENLQKVTDGKLQWEAANEEYNEKLLLYEDAKKQLNDAKTKLTLSEIGIAASNELIKAAEKTLQNLNSGNTGLSPEELEEAIIKAEAVLDQRKTDLAARKIKYAILKALYDAKTAELLDAGEKLEAGKKELDEKEKELEDADKKLEEAKKQIEQGGFDLQTGSIEAQTQYLNAKAEIDLKSAQLEETKKKLPQYEAEYAKKEAEVFSQVELARTMIEKGKSLLNSLKDASWFVHTRRDIPGYTSYGSAALSMRTLALAFSTFFFIVATLVSLTTMTRMVGEEREQLGCLKALGYTNIKILMKYLVYTIIACAFGSILGVLLGLYLMPKVFVLGWVITYQMPELQTLVHPSLVALGLFITIFLTLAAVVIACFRELREGASVLMRPKPPRIGKHILIERIGFIWNRLSFTSKSTARNLFRSKKRFLLSILGIAGCTALLVAGLGFMDSAKAVINKQFGDNGIVNFDFQLALKHEEKSSLDSEVTRNIKAIAGVKDVMLSRAEVYRGTSDYWEGDYEVNVYVPENTDRFSDFMRLADKKTGEILSPDNNGAIITDGFAKVARVKQGDYITIFRTEGASITTYKIRVGGIVENYAFHYVFMTPSYYENVFGEAPSFNSMAGLLEGELLTDIEYIQLENKINSFEDVSGSIFTKGMFNSFSHVINSLYIIIIVVIIVSAILSFIVLYLLNSTNIKERMRELATLKVLGLYDKDVSAYVYRENIIFTIISIPIGFLIGKVLHKIIVTTIVIEAVTLSQSVSLISYGLSVLLMLLFSLIVNIAMHRYLKKIDMVESLKSVE